MAPNSVNKKNQENVWLRLYEPKRLRRTSLHQKGDHVRISKKRMNFERGYTPNWSYEIYVINRVLKTTPVTYELRDLDGEVIEGGFYEAELQKVAKPEEFKIEKIIDKKRFRGKRHFLVKWLGYPDKFNQWIAATDINDLE